MEQLIHRLADDIVEHGRGIERMFILIFLCCAIMSPFVVVNYDLSEYLPETAQSEQGLRLMEEEFGYPGTARLMIEDVSLYQAKSIKKEIEALSQVDQVLWCDTASDVYMAESFIDYDDITDYYKDNCAVMDITFKSGDTEKVTHKTLDRIREIAGENAYLVGNAAQQQALQENISEEVNLVMVLAVVMILAILTLSTTSWFEPLLFLTVMGVAIVINTGTNILFPSISFMTKSVAAVLQLAVSMDYSIFLLHTYLRKKMTIEDDKAAMKESIEESINSILASGMTTIMGFLALAFMSFSIGFDMGLVLSKGIIISLFTVLFLMPALILRAQRLIVRTTHRALMPDFKRFSQGVYKMRHVIAVVVLVIAVPAYVGQGMNDFTYGTSAVSGGPGTKIYEEEQIINEKFGRSNLMMAIVPNDSLLIEREFADRVEELEYVKSITSLAQTIPEGIPESILPESVTGQLHTDDYARILIQVRSKEESELSFRASDEIQALLREYYPEGAYLVGVTPTTQDIKATINADYSFVNFLSLAAVAVVVGLAFKSIIMPIVVLIPIELAIFINMVIPYLVGTKMIFMGYLIVSCIQLGATVDYSILLSNHYIANRETMSKRDSAIEAIHLATPSILTSGVIVTVVGYMMKLICTIPAIADMGELIGRGALVSMIMVLSILPALLVYADKAITGNFGNFGRMLKKRKEKKAAKAKEVA